MHHTFLLVTLHTRPVEAPERLSHIGAGMAGVGPPAWWLFRPIAYCTLRSLKVCSENKLYGAGWQHQQMHTEA